MTQLLRCCEGGVGTTPEAHCQAFLVGIELVVLKGALCSQ